MRKHGKKYRAAFEKVEPGKKYTLEEGLAKVKEIAFAKFDETVELTLWLGVDPRKADQLVRGTVVLPHGVGKKVRVLVIAQQLQAATAGMLVGFKKLTVAKDQELRRQLREAGARYSVVKNTLARKAAEGTPFAQAADYFKGVTALALAEGDPVQLSKAVSKFVKDNPDVFSFKAGVVQGRVVALRDVEALATLPSKEVMISKIMFLINAQAQRLATVISAVPRNLAIVVKQAAETKGEA